MTSALFGLVSAASLGTADFMARYSARAVGAELTYAAVLLTGVIGTTAAFGLSGQSVSWDAGGNALALAHGVSVTLMCVLLYAALARGPVAVVAPIVAAHPALVLAVSVAIGTRPGAMQWAAMLTVIAGGLLVARMAGGHPQAVSAPPQEMRKTLLIALGACLAYVMLVLTGQAAAQSIGTLQTVCVGRWAGLVAITAWLVHTGKAGRIPTNWLPFIIVQGVLDTIGYLAFAAGLAAQAPHVAMVVSSTFSVVTVLLARLVLKEKINSRQWAAIAIIAAGTAVLASGG